MATPSNWISSDGDVTAATSWSGGVYPGSGEAAILGGTFSNQSMLLNLSGAAVRYPDTLVVRDDYYGDIGGPGNPLVNLQPGEIVIRGHGKYYIAAAGASEIVINSPDAYAELVTNAYTVTTLAGETYFPGTYNGTAYGFDVTGTVHVAGETATVTVAASTSTAYPAAVIVEAGYLLFQQELASNATNRLLAMQTGGKWRQEGVIDDEYVYIYGGVFEYAPNASPSAKAPNFYVNGVLDVSESEYNIPVTRLVIGPQGEIRGSALETLNASVDLDLRMDYP